MILKTTVDTPAAICSRTVGAVGRNRFPLESTSKSKTRQLQILERRRFLNGVALLAADDVLYARGDSSKQHNNTKAC